MAQHFTHLHLHTEFSLLDGAIKLDQLIQFGKDNKLQALAITDHGNIFGAVKFSQMCKKAGIKPVIGMEAYTIPDKSIKSATDKYYHMTILVQNEIGYRNLCKLISFSFKEGFYFRPRIDYNILQHHHEGLIMTSGCLGGHIPQLLLENKDQQARTQIEWFLQLLGNERFYFEIQPEDQAEQKVVNDKILALSKEYGITCLATADCHYPALDDRTAHEIMLCIQTHNKLNDSDRYSFGECKPYLRTPEEMLSCFPNNPETIWNTGKVADLCDFSFKTGTLFFPEFEIPKNHTQTTYFKKLCQKGFDKLLDRGAFPAEQKELYQQRLNLEIDLIEKMGFVGYFLVVSDFTSWSRANGVPVGPGRGSAAGAIVAWVLEITNIDPIRYNLLFERFLNPERVSMPDIDIDFCIEGREKVIQYVRDKYGHDNVCNIITFGTMLAKGVIKDVARVLGFPFEDANSLTDLIPEQLKITLQEAYDQNADLRTMISSNPRVAELFNIAKKLEGLTRHASMHAAGIVISPRPIDEVLPVYIPPKSDVLVTQFSMTDLEYLGYLKMDMLGLKNLTLIKKALLLIKKNHGIDLDIDKLPIDDKKTFQLLCDGKTSGVFQLESDGIKDVLRKLQPEKFEDIIAVNALYRPGPLGSGMVDDFIERRHGRQKITYLFEELKPILEETYGVIVYQEQVMKLASTVGGYSLGESDILRRAMGKKKVEVMAEQRAIFLKRAKERGFDEKKSAELFDLMEYFAGYGFNKSHSAAYAMIAYQTAYLKATFPAEFMACLITLECTNTDKMTFYLEEAKSMGLEVARPDINLSEVDFAPSGNKILFGLQGIKNVGLASLENILQERAKKPFNDLLDFCSRIDLRTSNKRVLENLVCAGAFDAFPGNRAQKIDELPQIMNIAAEQKKTRETGQMGLFSCEPVLQGQVENYPAYAFEPKNDWTDKEKLEKEKEVIGFYLSAHPLDSYKKQLRRIQTKSITDIMSLFTNKKHAQEPLVICCGLVKSHKTILTKKGDKMAFVQLEDASGDAEIIVFPKVYSKIENWLNQYNIFVIKGGLDITSPNKCKIKANLFIPLDLLHQEWPEYQSARIEIPSHIPVNTAAQQLATIKRGTIPLEVVFYENGKRIKLSSTKKIALNLTEIEALEQHEIQITLGL
jgi:DNA polymerase-3 subunit alpha